LAVRYPLVKILEDKWMPGHCLLTLEGEIDLAGSQKLESDMARVLVAKNAVLVVDLAAVSFVNTPGWAVLLNYQQEAGTFGGRVFICGLHGRPKDSFEIAGIEGLLEVVTDRSEAV
jgi:anti-anti-sigma factor